MGEYLFIQNKKGLIPKLKKVYDKYLKSGKEKFLNDFGQVNSFEDVFEITRKNQKADLRFKTGVNDVNGGKYHEFYSKSFILEILNVLRLNKVKYTKY